MAPGMVELSRLLLGGVVGFWVLVTVVLGLAVLLRSLNEARMGRHLVREVSLNLAQVRPWCERCRERRAEGESC